MCGNCGPKKNDESIGFFFLLLCAAFCVTGFVNSHLLQQKIHSSFAANSSVWAALKLDVETVLEGIPNTHIFDAHLLREFNRKVYSLGFEGLAFIPHDAGYRYISGSEESIASNIVLGSNNLSVIGSNNNPVLGTDNP